MSVAPGPESLELFASEKELRPRLVRNRRRIARLRRPALLAGVFTLGVIAGSYIRGGHETDAPVEQLVASSLLPPVVPLHAPVRASPAVADLPTPPGRDAVERRSSSDLRAIRVVVNRYRDAFSTLDVGAVRAVWPTADVSALRAQFATLAEQNLDFEACRIAAAGTRATVSCAGVLESGFSAGARRPRVARRQWQFTLRRAGAQWTITNVRAEPG